VKPTDLHPDFSPTCLDCGYRLIGLAAGPCPECGRPFDPDDPVTLEVPMATHRRRGLAVGFACLGLAFLAGLGVIAAGALVGHYICRPQLRERRPDAPFGYHLIVFAVPTFTGLLALLGPVAVSVVGWEAWSDLSHSVLMGGSGWALVVVLAGPWIVGLLAVVGGGVSGFLTTMTLLRTAGADPARVRAPCSAIGWYVATAFASLAAFPLACWTAATTVVLTLGFAHVAWTTMMFGLAVGLILLAIGLVLVPARLSVRLAEAVRMTSGTGPWSISAGRGMAS